MSAARPLLALVALLAGCDFFGVRRCATDYECGAGVGWRCVRATSDATEGTCQESDPAVAASYLNRRARVCAERGHDTDGVSRRTNRMSAGIPGCERVWRTATCRRCWSDVPVTAAWYEGGGCPPSFPRCPQ